MIISDSVAIENFSSEIAWASLQRYQNISRVSQQIVRLHGLSKSHLANSKKQAKQLRYCLMQAREYYSASNVVSLATRPTLLYYSTMCLALAEILLKHTGDSSLDRAREQHRHHGLTFECALNREVNSANLSSVASLLRARPLIVGNDKRAGTFHLWHQTARETPLVGKETETDVSGGTLERVVVIAASKDEQLPLVPAQGLSLLDCLKKIPGMQEYLQHENIASDLVRARVTGQINRKNGSHLFSLVVHPSVLSSRFFQNILLHPSLHERVNLREFPDGGVFEFRSVVDGQVEDDLVDQFNIPPGAVWNSGEIRFWYEQQALNEFGFIYVALFIAGNYARYYPDRWLSDVENSNSLALAIEELIRVADAKMAWLTLSELDRKCYVARS